MIIYRYCPRCDREFSGFTVAEAMALVRAHVIRSHSDDPEMFSESLE